MHKILCILWFSLALPGCATVQLPLCSAVAQLSSEPRQPRENVNRYLRERAAERSIVIVELSPYVAEYRGTVFAIPWLLSVYPHMLCAFDPDRTPIPQSLFRSCMHHATEWMEIVRNGQAEDLVGSGQYAYNCIDPMAQGVFKQSLKP